MRARVLPFGMIAAANLFAAVAIAATFTAWASEDPASPVRVGDAASQGSVRAASSPVLAIDPTNADRVLLASRIEHPRLECDVFSSSDAGESWRKSRLPDPPIGERCYAPRVVFARDGRAHLLVAALPERGREPLAHFLYTSHDGGVTFGSPRRVLPAYAFQATLAEGRDGSLYLVWVSGGLFSRHGAFGMGPPPNPIMMSVSRDRGRSFSKPVRVSRPHEELVGAPALAVAPNGHVYVLYTDFRDDVFSYHAFPGRYGGRHSLVVAVSRDGGRTFRHHDVEPRVVPPRPFLVHAPPSPALAVHPRTGSLVAAWEDGRAGAPDVLLRGSRDAGRTWTPARALFEGPPDQRTPALTFMADGRLLSLAYRISSGWRTQVVMRRSDDGGQTFSEEAALNRDPFDASGAPRLPHRPSDVDLGASIGIAAADETALSAWVQTNGPSGAAPRTDVFVTPVPDDVPDARALAPAPEPGPAEASRADRRLRGRCLRGRRVASRRSPLAVVGSFVSALDRGELVRAYRYLDPRWRSGRGPVRRPHPFGAFAAEYRSLTCARILLPETYERSADRRWSTLRVWFATRRGRGPTRLGIGMFYTHSNTGRAPWTIMGYWARELRAE